MGSLGPDHHREWTEKATPASAMSAAGGMKAGRDRARLRPCSKAKIDELFVAWLSIGKTQEPPVLLQSGCTCAGHCQGEPGGW